MSSTLFMMAERLVDKPPDDEPGQRPGPLGESAKKHHRVDKKSGVWYRKPASCRLHWTRPNCRATLPSSWTATAVGPSAGACRASRDIGAARSPGATACAPRA